MILGDCTEKLKEIPDDSIHLVVTSPPYDDLREYKGYTFNFEKIASELIRVLKAGGIIVWVVGDATIQGSETGTSFKQALHFKDLGLNIHDTMVYQKEIPTWNISSKRYRQNIEYMFVFSKGKVLTFNPIEDQKVKNMSPRKCKSNRNGEPKYEMYIPKKEYTARHNIWKYPVGGISIPHPAPFPLQLAKDHIISWSNEGDTVLDPFMGSGTTGIAAEILNRKFIGIEIAEDYFNLAKQRIENPEDVLIVKDNTSLLEYEEW